MQFEYNNDRTLKLEKIDDKKYKNTKYKKPYGRENLRDAILTILIVHKDDVDNLRLEECLNYKMYSEDIMKKVTEYINYDITNFEGLDFIDLFDRVFENVRFVSFKTKISSFYCVSEYEVSEIQQEVYTFKELLNSDLSLTVAEKCLTNGYKESIGISKIINLYTNLYPDECKKFNNLLGVSYHSLYETNDKINIDIFKYLSKKIILNDDEKYNKYNWRGICYLLHELYQDTKDDEIKKLLDKSEIKRFENINELSELCHDKFAETKVICEYEILRYEEQIILMEDEYYEFLIKNNLLPIKNKEIYKNLKNTFKSTSITNTTRSVIIFSFFGERLKELFDITDEEKEELFNLGLERLIASNQTSSIPYLVALKRIGKEKVLKIKNRIDINKVVTFLEDKTNVIIPTILSNELSYLKEEGTVIRPIVESLINKTHFRDSRNEPEWSFTILVSLLDEGDELNCVVNALSKDFASKLMNKKALLWGGAVYSKCDDRGKQVVKRILEDCLNSLNEDLQKRTCKRIIKQLKEYNWDKFFPMLTNIDNIEFTKLLMEEEI